MLVKKQLSEMNFHIMLPSRVGHVIKLNEVSV